MFAGPVVRRRQEIVLRSRHQILGSGLIAALLPMLIVGALIAGCGSNGSSGPSADAGAVQLLHATFAAHHTLTSGRVSFALTLAPAARGAGADPVTVSISGPFQSRGAGRPPASDFTLAIEAHGERGGLSIVSTGTAGYLTVGRSSYELPAASLTKLEGELSPVSSSGSLSDLGIDPLRWLEDPVVVGHATIGGAATTHIRAKVRAQALVRALGSILSGAGTLTGAGLGAGTGTTAATALSPAAERQVARAVKRGGVDVWTGTADRTLRRLQLAVTLPVDQKVASLIGGARSARMELVLQYSDLGRPQSVHAPAHARPYSQLAGALGSQSGSDSQGLADVQVSPAYQRCMTDAGDDVAKMQRCAPLVDGER